MVLLVAKVEIGSRVRIAPTKRVPSGEFEVVRIAGDYIGLVGDEYKPDPKASPVELAVHYTDVIEVISGPVAAADISESPAPQISNIQNF